MEWVVRGNFEVHHMTFKYTVATYQIKKGSKEYATDYEYKRIAPTWILHVPGVLGGYGFLHPCYVNLKAQLRKKFPA